MTSYIILTLDTTAPNVEVLIPNYTTQQIRTEIRLVANEPLGEWQEIYVIDSQGDRHDLTFLHDNETNEYVGQVFFEGYPLGIATIYATLVDEVGNKSPLVSKSFKIVKSDILEVSLSEIIREVVIDGLLLYIVNEKEDIADVSIKVENRNDVIVIDGNAYNLSIKGEEYKAIAMDKENNITAKEVK